METFDLVRSPFNEQQIRILKYYQSCEFLHPFTCGNDHDGQKVLIITKDGWKCPSCDYTQDWVPSFIFNIIPK